MPPVAIQGREALCNLLGYADELLKAGERVVSDLARDAVMAFHEHEIAGLEGITAKDDGDCWLRVARLAEVAPPEPDPEYRPWLADPAESGVFAPPRLAETRLLAVGIEEASELIAAGLAMVDDVMQPRGGRANRADAVDVLLRLENLPEFAAGFEAWLAGAWTQWTESERPRRRSIAVYHQLFAVQQRMSSMGDDGPVETVFGVGMARWDHPAAKVNAPLIEAAVELELDPEDGALVIRSREQAPRLALRPFDLLEIESVGRLYREASARLQSLYDDPDVGFSPYMPASFEPVLRMCHARLSAAAVYERDARENEADRAPQTADGKLRISDGWVLYVRQRSLNFRRDDIQRLIAQVREAGDEADLPAPARQLTSRPGDRRVEQDIVDLGSTGPGLPETLQIHGPARSPAGTERSGEPEQSGRFFFPLPYNDEQIDIVRRLEQDSVSGVVVQGPPGTGKTHTIANIIAHYMATGRRVLVSAHAPEALAALRQKLPESIRDLAISVIHSDREGSRKLEQAIDILASQVRRIDKRAYNERRIELERVLAEAQAALAEIDDRTRHHAELNLTEIAYRGERLMPMDLAAKVESERPLHAWLPDELGCDAALRTTIQRGRCRRGRTHSRRTRPRHRLCVPSVARFHFFA